MNKADLFEQFKSKITGRNKLQAILWCTRRGMFTDYPLIKKLRDNHYIFKDCIPLGFPDTNTGRWYVNILEEYDHFASSQGIDLCEDVADDKLNGKIDLVAAFSAAYDIIMSDVAEMIESGHVELSRQDIKDAANKFIKAYNTRKSPKADPLENATSGRTIDDLKNMLNKLY